MSTPPSPGRRLHIDRLELDLGGIAPATAEVVAQMLGPALGHAMMSNHPRVAPGDRLDAGRISSPISTGPADLAAGIAQRIAQTLQREGT